MEHSTDQTKVSDTATCEVCGKKAVKHCQLHKDYCVEHWWEHLANNSACLKILFSEFNNLLKKLSEEKK
jgi:hypothetical protein